MIRSPRSISAAEPGEPSLDDVESQELLGVAAFMSRAVLQVEIGAPCLCLAGNSGHCALATSCSALVRSIGSPLWTGVRTAWIPVTLTDFGGYSMTGARYSASAIEPGPSYVR